MKNKQIIFALGILISFALYFQFVHPSTKYDREAIEASRIKKSNQ